MDPGLQGNWKISQPDSSVIIKVRETVCKQAAESMAQLHQQHNLLSVYADTKVTFFHRGQSREPSCPPTVRPGSHTAAASALRVGGHTAYTKSISAAHTVNFLFLPVKLKPVTTSNPLPLVETSFIILTVSSKVSH